MHGVKRLFSWMIPRFDPDRFRVSLVSLRKKDLSEETLEALGIDITYLERSKFDPLTLPALLRVIDRQADRHPAPARLRRDDVRPDGRRRCADLRRSFTSTPTSPTRPGFRRSPTALLEPYTDIAMAVSKSTADFVIQRAADAGVEGEGRLPRRAARGVQPLAQR